MNEGFLWGLCKCNGAHVCLLCKILTGLCLAAVIGATSVFLSFRKKKAETKE